MAAAHAAVSSSDLHDRCTDVQYVRLLASWLCSLCPALPRYGTHLMTAKQDNTLYRLCEGLTHSPGSY